jgi:thiol-disulfide isomerase/thioredoxin
MKTRWPLLLLIGLSAFTLLMAMSSRAVQPALAFPPTSNLPTRVSFPTLALETPQPTATRERDALTPPPDSDVAEPLLTLTALSEIAYNQPTPTDGPSEIIADGKPHLVDFNAFWCSPCNQMRPGIIELREQYAGRVTFDDINTDNRASQKLARKYRVTFIPLIVLLDKDLKEVNRLEGYHTKQEIDDALNDLVAAR